MKHSQNELILEYLQAGNSITPLEALGIFSCFRLGARIWDLKRAGHRIKTKIITNKGRRFARYWLEGETNANQ